MAATDNIAKPELEAAGKEGEVKPNGGKDLSERQRTGSTGGTSVTGAMTHDSLGSQEARSGTGTAAVVEEKVPKVEEKANLEGNNKAPTTSRTGHKSDDDNDEGKGGKGVLPPHERSVAKLTQGNLASFHKFEEPPSKLREQQQQTSSKEKVQPNGQARETGGGVVGATEPAVVHEEDRTAGQADSSDEEDEDDGFTVVVGRETAPAAAPVATKIFLRGTNTLVNNASSTATAKGSGSSGTSARPVSAAAGIASLVPSKGAPEATEIQSLKPGEYPPTAELQQSTGGTAFDVDIDGMEEQPWRHPGVDIADFFNYGFTEESWRVYCEKQLRNRYDLTNGRSKNTNVSGGLAGNSNSMINQMRFGGDRPGRVENSLQPQRPPQVQMHHINGPPGPNFQAQGPAGNNGAWRGGGPDHFSHGYGPGPPSGRGNGSPPWFDGQLQQQQHPMQMQMQMGPQNRQQFGPGPGPGGAMIRPGMSGGNNSMGNNSVVARRSRSPDPRNGPRENKMQRLR